MYENIAMKPITLHANLKMNLHLKIQRKGLSAKIMASSPLET